MRISDWSSDVCSSDLPAISARSIVAVELFYWANAFGQKLVGRAAIQQVDDGDDRTQRKPRRHAPERALDAGELAFVRSKPLGRMDCQLAAVFRRPVARLDALVSKCDRGCPRLPEGDRSEGH